ncbi:MAG: phosphotransferase [bacterium]|nr:phosphotransferase [bacterium]
MKSLKNCIEDYFEQDLNSVTIKKIPYGVDNDVYYVYLVNMNTSLVLKLYTKKTIKDVRRLCSIQNNLIASNILIPNIVAGPIRLNNRIGVFYDYVRGNHLNPLDDHTKAITRIMAHYHRVPQKDGDILTEIYSKNLFRKWINASRNFEHIDKIKLIFNNIDISYLDSLVKCFIHGDFSCSNFILNNEGYYLLDHDHSRLTYRLTDIARSQIFFSFTNNKTFNSIKSHRFLIEYNKYNKLTDVEYKSFIKHLQLELIKMILQTYYYVRVLNKVPNSCFQNKFNQSYQSLFKKLITISNK